MTFVNAYTEFFKRYVDFGGKTRRTQFWFAYLWQLIIFFVLGLLSGLTRGGVAVTFDVITSLYGAATVVPMLSLSIRRLRDAGKSWKNIFWLFLPLVGEIILLVKFCAPSVESPVEQKVEEPKAE